MYICAQGVKILHKFRSTCKGHGSNDKLYITHSEHAGLAGGQHSASGGYRKKGESVSIRSLTPFDCCALSQQPFEHPVCARNADGSGTVFELTNIIPWLKQHKNTHPITLGPLSPSSLITLHYARNAQDKFHDPIAFKTFSEHSHIVAIATTGNVYLAESIKSMGGHDLVAEKDFKKEDIITLQNPHAVPPALPTIQENTAASSVPIKPTTSKVPENKTIVALTKTKAPIPYNISPYSTGLPGASLTSTAVDPHTATSSALYDEEELMYDAIQNPPKGKGKEKDVGKRRAYVRVVTSLGGSLNLELFCEKAPKTCYNFLMLARQGKYDGCPFHRLVPGFMIQTGDPTGTGRGGQSYWGTPFRDEYDLKNASRHDSRGIVAMANKGKGTNGSQFYLTFRPSPHLDSAHTVFGKLVGGEEVLDALEAIGVKEGTDKPAKLVKITEVVIYQDPFEEYKMRLAKKLSHQSQASTTLTPPQGVKAIDAVAAKLNWFGEHVKAENSGGNSSSIIGGEGVGKYLKRARELPTVPAAQTRQAVVDEPLKKKKKIGFGDFEGW